MIILVVNFDVIAAAVAVVGRIVLALPFLLVLVLVPVPVSVPVLVLLVVVLVLLVVVVVLLLLLSSYSPPSSSPSSCRRPGCQTLLLASVITFFCRLCEHLGR